MTGRIIGAGEAERIGLVNRVVPGIIAKGKYVRPAMGIQVDDDASRRHREDGVLFIAPGAVLGRTAVSEAAAVGLRRGQPAAG